MQSEAARLRSFHPRGKRAIQWPHPSSFKATAEALADAGFYFSPDQQSLDRVCCFLCEKHLANWGPEDDPFREHVDHTPKCPWSLSRCSLEMDKDELGQFKFASTGRLPMNRILEKARRDTFEDWPHDKVEGHGANSRNMAKAGFVFTPIKNDDTVTCFYCQTKLDGWESEDDPYTEHKKRNPSCPFFTATTTKAKPPVSKTTKTKKQTTRSTDNEVDEPTSTVAKKATRSQAKQVDTSETLKPKSSRKGKSATVLAPQSQAATTSKSSRISADKSTSQVEEPKGVEFQEPDSEVQSGLRAPKLRATHHSSSVEESTRTGASKGTTSKSKGKPSKTSRPAPSVLVEPQRAGSADKKVKKADGLHDTELVTESHPNVRKPSVPAPRPKLGSEPEMETRMNEAHMMVEPMHIGEDRVNSIALDTTSAFVQDVATPRPFSGTQRPTHATSAVASVPIQSSPFAPPTPLLPSIPHLILSAEERQMGLEEWIRHEMARQYDQLRLDSIKRLQEFRTRAAEVRSTIVAL